MNKARKSYPEKAPAPPPTLRDQAARIGAGGRTGSVVGACLRSAPGRPASAGVAAPRLIAALQAGLPVHELEELQSTLDLPIERLAPLLGISRATLHRRKAAGRLDPAESDRVVRFARLMGRAVEVLESEEHARRWLASPQFGLGGAVPLEYAMTEVGAREVEDLLGRIEHGVYS